MDLEDTSTPATIGEATVQAPIHLAVTITVTLFVGILFILVYIQLCMVICCGYRLVSYQSILLFDILLWAVLRLTLYSFYFYHCCELVERLPIFFEWLLVAFPSALQYVSLAILVHYFGEVSLCARVHATVLRHMICFVFIVNECTTSCKDHIL